MPSDDNEKLQDVIDDIDRLDSERPSQIEINNIYDRKKTEPPKHETLAIKILAAVAGVGAIAEVVRRLLSK